MSHSIYFNFIIKSDKFSVYKAVSEPGHLENWWPLKCSGIPRVGEQFNFNFTDKYDWYAEVTSCKQWDHIHYKMTKSDDDWNSTTFGFKLKEKDNGTCLNFFHTDWSELNNHFKHSSFCWAMLLNGLKSYLEKGEIIPFEKRS
ncbi:SRPBCC family protein [Winogradskyella flava]|uniref:SRPBCC domain-containing protein n=1 Tax=Winogradskyella flava TaxID=1884876 RepID=A0A842IM93_9FLAO|nr:SRPBCC domain-containing protein [Winogradskyella flava]MBC2844362.1 SRPBCC domain-containing protein [Winogradskyella flava]